MITDDIMMPPHTTTVEHVDVQPFLQRVCDSMAMDEMVHDKQFSLFDAMNAIEIGDPKMDIGLLHERPAATVAELAHAGLAPVDVNEKTIVAIGDRLMQMEATWQSGSVLGMTVFTSLYILDPRR